MLNHVMQISNELVGAAPNRREQSFVFPIGTREQGSAKSKKNDPQTVLGSPMDGRNKRYHNWVQYSGGSKRLGSMLGFSS
jgi:hypothetical protein